MTINNIDSNRTEIYHIDLHFTKTNDARVIAYSFIKQKIDK